MSYKLSASSTSAYIILEERRGKDDTRDRRSIKVHCTSIIRPVVQEMAVFYNEYIACNGKEKDGATKTISKLSHLLSTNVVVVIDMDMRCD